MANQYQNFTNPTIVPDQPMGWQAASQGVGDMTKSVGDYLSNQVNNKQALQLGQAKAFMQAQADAWGKMQDPLAQALERARLAQGGFPMQMLGNTNGGQMPSMQDMLQGNPYAGMIANPGMGSGPSNPTMSPNPPSPMPSSPDVSSGASNPAFNPLFAGSHSSGNLVQSTIKMSPWGTPLPAEYTNLDAVKAEAQAKQSIQPESPDAASAITYSGVMADGIKNIKNIVNKKDFDWGIGGAALASHGDPSLISFGNLSNVGWWGGKNPQSDDLLAITNQMNTIKRSVFGEGGKNLTNIEKDIIFRTLNPQGQSKGEWLKLLDASQKILETKAKLLTKDPSKLDFNQFGQMSGTEAPAVSSAQPQQANGKGKALDANMARQILQSAGGDKDKARALAQQQGYTF